MPVNRRGFRRGLTSSEASLPSIGKPVGETRRGQIVDLEGKPPRGQRVLDARSGVRAGDREYKESSNPESISIKNSFKQNGAVILLDIELPLSPRLRAASCRLEVYFNFSRDASTPNHQHRYTAYSACNTLAFFASSTSSCGRPFRISLVFEAFETRTPRLRNFDMEQPFSYCYELQSDHRLV
jgi:hypothetical protein